MKEYVDKDWLIDSIYNERPENILEYIALFPTADVHPNVIGEWKNNLCTICHRAVHYEFNPDRKCWEKTKYCPHCGAKMSLSKSALHIEISKRFEGKMEEVRVDG